MALDTAARLTFGYGGHVTLLYLRHGDKPHYLDVDLRPRFIKRTKRKEKNVQILFK